MRRRGELVERSFAHCLETGAMRRTWLRGHTNILKRYLVHVAAFNLGLVMRQMLGAGTPRGLAALNGLAQRLCDLARALRINAGDFVEVVAAFAAITLHGRCWGGTELLLREKTPSSTGC